MVWPGVLVLFTGAVLTFALDRPLGPVGGGTVGIITMARGAALLITGLVRLNRRRPGKPLPTYRDAGRERIYQTGKGKIFAMITAVVYILSPIDIVPDFLLPIGVI